MLFHIESMYQIKNITIFSLKKKKKKKKRGGNQKQIKKVK